MPYLSHSHILTLVWHFIPKDNTTKKCVCCFNHFRFIIFKRHNAFFVSNDKCNIMYYRSIHWQNSLPILHKVSVNEAIELVMRSVQHAFTFKLKDFPNIHIHPPQVSKRISLRRIIIHVIKLSKELNTLRN